MRSPEVRRVEHFETPIRDGNGGREKADVIAAKLDQGVTQYILVPEGRMDNVRPMSEHPSIVIDRSDAVAHELQARFDIHGDPRIVRHQLATLAHAAFGAMTLSGSEGPRVWTRVGEDVEYRELLGSVLGMKETAEPVRPDLAVVETRTKAALAMAVRTLKILDDTHVTILPSRPQLHPLWQGEEQAG
jgi:hypothetical protein